jgi:hypothetical protein
MNTLSGRVSAPATGNTIMATVQMHTLRSNPLARPAALILMISLPLNGPSPPAVRRRDEASLKSVYE